MESRQRTLAFAKIVIAEIIVFKVTDLFFEIDKTVRGNQTSLYLAFVILLKIAAIFGLIANYFLAKKYLKISTFYNTVQTLLTTFFLLE